MVFPAITFVGLFVDIDDEKRMEEQLRKQKVDLEDNRNLFTVSTILIAGIGGLVLDFGKIQITAVATALILGILVNLILHAGDKKKKA